MYERSLIQALLAEVEQEMSQRDADRARTITVSVGDHTNVELEKLQLAFEELAASTAAQGAKLEVRQVPVEAHCESCDCEFIVNQAEYHCPQCGQAQVCVTRGEEMVLENLVLE